MIYNDSRILKSDSYTSVIHISAYMGFPGGSDGKESLQCRRLEFDPWVGKIPWRRKWQPILIFSPGKPHGQRRATVHRVAKSWT